MPLPFCRYMNIVMKDCVFTDPRGDSFKFDMFFVQARNIRNVHIPMNVSASHSSPIYRVISFPGWYSA